MVKPQNSGDWWTIIVATIFTIVVILTPIYIAKEVNEGTQEVTAILEREAAEANIRAIRINALTIACVTALDPEERTNEALIMCIEEGLDRLQEEAERRSEQRILEGSE